MPEAFVEGTYTLHSTQAQLHMQPHVDTLPRVCFADGWAPCNYPRLRRVHGACNVFVRPCPLAQLEVGAYIGMRHDAQHVHLCLPACLPPLPHSGETLAHSGNKEAAAARLFNMHRNGTEFAPAQYHLGLLLVNNFSALWHEAAAKQGACCWARATCAAAHHTDRRSIQI